VIGAALKQEMAHGFTGRLSLVANTSSILAVAGLSGDRCRFTSISGY